MKTFKVLIVDDGIYRAWKANPSYTVSPGATITTGAEMVSQMSALADKLNVKLELYITGDLELINSVKTVTSDTSDWQEDYLWSLDVLILDFGGISLKAEWYLEKSDLENSTQPEINELNTKYEGAAFYLKNKKKLGACQLVNILTQYDSGFESSSSKTPAVIKKYIHPCLLQDKPQTVISQAETSGFTEVVERIKAALYRADKGYTQLENWSAIEFAAKHDLPVMIVGETGTGKEGIAMAIHNQWRNEKKKENPNALIHHEPAIVNCAGLNSQLARDELFGHVKGSFSEAYAHYIGEILTACGCEGFEADTHPKNSANDFASKLLNKNKTLLKKTERDTNISFTNDGPFGTLFLDEFGDLPSDVQTLLLRYLQTKDVKPIGYPERIKGANLRVIVATSDPRVAAFVGEEMHGTNRSRSELQRPLREDLLFRVKGQIIRAVPVNSDNVAATINHLIEKSGYSGIWDDEARKYLEVKITELLVKIDEKTEINGSPVENSMVFGHRRELVRIIDLANAYVKTAKNRGVRPEKDKITAEVIDLVWKPSAIVVHEIQPFIIERQNQLEETIEFDENLDFNIESILHKAKAFFDEIGEPLSEEWLGKPPKDRAKELRTRVMQMKQNRQDDVVEKCHNEFRGFPATVVDKAFATTHNTFHKWFTSRLKN